MPTPRGLGVAGTGVALFALGQLLGAHSLQQLGFALLILVLAAVAVVRLGRHDIEVRRTVSPERATPGGRINLSLEVENRGRGSAPLLLLSDRLPSGMTGSARFAIRGIEPGGKRAARLEMEAGERGRHRVGPLEMSIVDPFGLARVRGTHAGTTSFLVRPRMERLALPRDLGERRSTAFSTRRQPTAERGEDFYTMREYIEGDDLRKIHWPSTAKRARYMIKQEETPWQTRATILLEDSASAHAGVGSGASFERAVQAAASLVDLYHRTGYSFRLVSTHRGGRQHGKGNQFYEATLDYLATINPAPPGEPGAFVGRIADVERSSTGEATLMVACGDLSLEEATAISRSKRRFRQVIVLSFPSHRFTSMTTKSRWEGEARVVEASKLLTRSGCRMLALGPDDPLGVAWAGLSSPAGRDQRWALKPELA